MVQISPTLRTTLKQQLLTSGAGLAVEMAVTYGAMPVFIRTLPTNVYTTIIFVLGGGVSFIATHITRTLFKSQKVCFLNSIKEENVRGAIYLTLLASIATLAMILHV